MRVVLDTNVIVAGLAYPAGTPGRIVAAWRKGALEVVLSPWILTECERVLADCVRLRDAADEPVSAALLASGAQVLVTGDKDLLALSDRFAILSAADFCARYAP